MEATGKNVDIREMEGGKSAAEAHTYPTPQDHKDFWASAVQLEQVSNECQPQNVPGATWNTGVRLRLVSYRS